MTDGVSSESTLTHDDKPDGARPARRLGLLSWVKLGFLALVLLFGCLFVVSRRDSLGDALGQLSWLAVGGSLLVGTLGMFVSMLVWRELLADLGSPLSIRSAGRVFFIAQLGKYVPGSVWTIIAQAELGRELKVPRKSSFTVALLAIVLSIAVGLGVAAVLLPFGTGEATRRYWWIVLVAPLLLACMHPRLIVGVLDWLLRRIGREPLPVQPTYGGLLRASGWQAVCWVVLGLHAWLLVVSIGGSPGEALPVTVGGFALAFCLGLLFLPAPAGAGIRDVALVVALSGVLSGDDALAVALVSRVLLALVDFGLAGAWWLASRRR